MFIFFFFFNDTATTEIYTLSLHDALPILDSRRRLPLNFIYPEPPSTKLACAAGTGAGRTGVLKGNYGRKPSLISQLRYKIGRDTSELQSRQYLVCRLLLEKKKKSSIYFSL